MKKNVIILDKKQNVKRKTVNIIASKRKLNKLAIVVHDFNFIFKCSKIALTVQTLYKDLTDLINSR